MTTATDTDSQFMARAQALAYRGLYTTRPNPRVGCVIVREGQVVAEGWHQRAGGPHAEIVALQQAAERGQAVAGATVYVSLEPCSFQGKTGPCSQALIQAGVSRVVYGMEDPNPQVAGQGLQQLREAGIAVTGPVLEGPARDLNPGFSKRMTTGQPWVRIKMAMSLDGRTAMASGESKWITGPYARQDVQRLRARSCAVISGIETVLRDKANLTVRAGELGLADVDEAAAIARQQPLRVILDSAARLPADAPLLASPGELLWVTAGPGPATLPGPQVRHLNLADNHGRVSLPQLLSHLGQAQCNEVLVEAGATLAGEFVRQGLVDELIIYMAAKLLGSDARPLFNLPLHTMAAQLPLQIQDIRAVGDDWRITAILDKEG